MLPIEDWYNSGPVFCYGLECRLSHVEMWSGRIAPTAIVTWECIVRRTEVGGCDGNVFTLETPLGYLFCIANYLIAASARLAIVEQGCAECSCFCSITVSIEITITTSSTWKTNMVIISSKPEALYIKFMHWNQHIEEEEKS